MTNTTTTDAGTRLSIEQIDELCAARGISRGRFWNYAMGEGQSAALPADDVARLLDEIEEEHDRE